MHKLGYVTIKRRVNWHALFSRIFVVLQKLCYTRPLFYSTSSHTTLAESSRGTSPRFIARLSSLTVPPTTLSRTFVVISKTHYHRKSFYRLVASNDMIMNGGSGGGGGGRWHRRYQRWFTDCAVGSGDGETGQRGGRLSAQLNFRKRWNSARKIAPGLGNLTKLYLEAATTADASVLGLSKVCGRLTRHAEDYYVSIL